MKYAIVYVSETGNTKRLAQAIKDKVGDCYFGEPSDAALSAETIFVGFWAARNSCGERIKEFLDKVSNKRVFLFGTAGYDNTTDYFEAILDSVKPLVPSSCTLIGTYMCQGYVSEAMQARIKENKPDMYEAIREKLIESEGHPSDSDIFSLMSEVDKII